MKRENKSGRRRRWEQSWWPVGLLSPHKGRADPASCRSWCPHCIPVLPARSSNVLRSFLSSHRTDRQKQQFLTDNPCCSLPFPVCTTIICALEHTADKEPWIRGLVCLITPWTLSPPAPNLNCCPVSLSSPLCWAPPSKEKRMVYHHTVLCSLSSSAGNEFFWQHKKPALHPPGYLFAKVKEKQHFILGWCFYREHLEFIGKGKQWPCHWWQWELLLLEFRCGICTRFLVNV